jgi:hypothetical protein
MIVFPQPTDPVIIYPLLTPFPYVQIYLYKARLLTNWNIDSSIYFLVYDNPPKFSNLYVSLSSN